MVNLFRSVPAEQGSLTAALLALLEHADRELLRSLLHKANIVLPTGPEGDLQFQFPADQGPPPAGQIVSAAFTLTVIAQAPGEAIEPIPSPAQILWITPSGKAPDGSPALSWEEVDRWLAGEAERYDPDTRTGFLIRQFRSFLPEMGIAYFPGFTRAYLEAAPDSLTVLSGIYAEGARFFERVSPALGALRPGLAEIRQARPEDLLAGYMYRDWGGGGLGPTTFLRIALHLPQAELQVSCWLMPGSPGDPHARLQTALVEENGALVQALRTLERPPLLWLWSASGEKKWPLEELHPDELAGLDWSQYQAGIQRSLPFDALATAGLVARVSDLADGLLRALEPVLTTMLH